MNIFLFIILILSFYSNEIFTANQIHPLIGVKVNLVGDITYLIIYTQISPSSAFTNLDSGDDIILRISIN